MRWWLLCLAAVGLLSGAATDAKAESLTTMFNYNNDQSGNMFDVKTFGNSLTATSFDLNLNNGTWDIQVYMKSGTWVGFDNQPGAWTLVDSIANVGSNGPNTPTLLNIASLELPANSTTGLYITTTAPDTDAMLYTNGSAVGAVAASNSDLEILQGAGESYPFAETFIPRIWNGTINYNVAASTPEPASITLLVSGVFAVGGFGFYRRRPRSRS
jgi:hypothetical protein